MYVRYDEKNVYILGCFEFRGWLVDQLCSSSLTTTLYPGGIRSNNLSPIFSSQVEKIFMNRSICSVDERIRM
jgi:hypothetical protein